MKPSYKDQIKLIQDACTITLESAHTADRVRAIDNITTLAIGLKSTDYVEEYPSCLSSNIKHNEANYRIMRAGGGRKAIVQKYIGPEKCDLISVSAHQIPEWWTENIPDSERVEVFMYAYLKVKNGW